MGLQAGLRIGRKFVLIHPVGQGGMATVWAAEDEERGRRVALKILNADLADRPPVVERFIAEARTMERLHSPFVPQIHEYGIPEDGVPFTAMELCEGVDLDVHLRAHGPLTLATTARLVTQVASALTEAHALGIVHRD
ncbi:MAG TPA: serine/threonine-protein kinase, partial [Polyangiaceae bacterium]